MRVAAASWAIRFHHRIYLVSHRSARGHNAPSSGRRNKELELLTLGVIKVLFQVEGRGEGDASRLSPRFKWPREDDTHLKSSG